MKNGIGDRFQQETVYHRDRLPGGYLEWSQTPALYKTYPDLPSFSLPPAQTDDGMSLWEALATRRSIRDFQRHPVSRQQVSQLLWAAQGITAEHLGHSFRTTPSAGALYPVETYIVINNVEDLPQGVYHYAVEGHVLEQIRAGDYRVAVARAALDQKIAYEASLVLVWTAIFERCKWKYKQRAYRYLYLDAGHIAQSVALASVALGLGSCQIGAIYDEEANALLGVDELDESTIYMATVGIPNP